MTEQDVMQKKMQATKKWVSEWNHIPTAAIEQLMRVEDVSLLTTNPPTDDFLPMWGTMFSFKEGLDEDWAIENPDLLEEAGICVYDVPSIGLVFGIDGAGYDFYESHWLPLYEKRGFTWHEFM